MFQRILAALVCVSLSFGATDARSEDKHVTEVKKYIASKIIPWLSDRAIVNAIALENLKHASLSAGEIEKLDKTWRAQIDAADKPLINAVLKSKVSAFLMEKKQASGGILTEIFLMDNRGLNVGQSDITSDYWQGDEAKWQKTFSVGPDAIFIDTVEKDDSTQELQVQASVSVKDPTTGKAIGAITLGINLAALML